MNPLLLTSLLALTTFLPSQAHTLPSTLHPSKRPSFAPVVEIGSQVFRTRGRVCESWRIENIWAGVVMPVCGNWSVPDETSKEGVVYGSLVIKNLKPATGYECKGGWRVEVEGRFVRPVCAQVGKLAGVVSISRFAVLLLRSGTDLYAQHHLHSRGEGEDEFIPSAASSSNALQSDESDEGRGEGDQQNWLHEYNWDEEKSPAPEPEDKDGSDCGGQFAGFCYRKKTPEDDQCGYVFFGICYRKKRPHEDECKVPMGGSCWDAHADEEGKRKRDDDRVAGEARKREDDPCRYRIATFCLDLPREGGSGGRFEGDW